jgi:hypothetical protein
MKDYRKYFIVKHGLDSLQALPNFIWRTGETQEPKSFRRVKKGDRWIGFAFTNCDRQEWPLSQVTGFYECTRESGYRPLPRHAWPCSGGAKHAWMVEGKPSGKQPRQPVGVPPIDDLLKRATFKGQTLVPVNRDEFELIRDYTLAHELDPADIPLLGREPRNEQEVLAIIIFYHQSLGIEKILRVRTAFPDLLVKLKGRAEPVHLELETYSKGFLLHGHDSQVCDRQFKTEDKTEKKPVGLLCWINNLKTKDANQKLMKCVHKVYELQSLVREGREIRW